MKQFVLRNRKAFGIGLALYNLLGGLAGLVLMYTLVNDETTFGAYLIVVPITAFYIVSLLSGVFYFWERQRWRFYFMGKLTLCLQVLQIMVSGFTYIFYFGPYLAIGMDFEPNFVMRFESITINFMVRFGETEEQEVLINLVPILLLIILRWLERNPVLKNEEAEGFLQEQQEVV